MKAYVKPDFNVTRYILSDTAIAQCTYTPGTTAGQLTVYCAIGGQSETVYASGCSTTNASIVSYNSSYYLVWYTYEGDMGSSGGAPSDSTTNLLKTLVVEAGYYSSTSAVPSGWHYASIEYREDTGEIMTNLSY